MTRAKDNDVSVAAVVESSERDRTGDKVAVFLTENVARLPHAGVGVLRNCPRLHYICPTAQAKPAVHGVEGQTRNFAGVSDLVGENLFENVRLLALTPADEVSVLGARVQNVVVLFGLSGPKQRYSVTAATCAAGALNLRHVGQIKEPGALGAYTNVDDISGRGDQGSPPVASVLPLSVTASARMLPV